MPHKSKSSAHSDPIPQNGIPLHKKKIEWKEYKLGEVANLSTRKMPISEVVSDNYISTENMIENKGGVKQASSIPGTGNATKYSVGDILISNIRPYFKKIWMANRNGGCSNDVLCLVPNEELVNRKYLYYTLCQDVFFDYVMLGSKGCKMPRGDKSHIMNWRFVFPPLSEQKRIASILGSLDDKIDLLHRENATLEAMAETLFRHYFIENPNPEWKEGKVSIYADHYKVSLNPKKSLKSVFSHYSIPAFDQGKTPSMETGESIQSNKYSIPGDCILFSKLNPHRDKRVWMIEGDLPDNPVCSTEFQIVFPKEKEYLFFLYGWLTNKENYSEIASGVGGTSGSHQRIDPKAIFSFSCPLVDANYLREYNNMISPLFLKQRNNQEEIFNLTKQRNILLTEFLSEKARS